MESAGKNPQGPPTSARTRILTVAAGVTLGLVVYQVIRFIYLAGIEILWDAARLVE